METYPQLVPLMILIPAIGAFINFFWGAKLGETWSSRIAIFCSALTFVVAFLLFTYLVNNHNEAMIVNPAFFTDWIRIGDEVNIPWQMRVDTLSVTMMMFVSFVATLIHIYASGYMHGDERFPRFFAYLNMFLAFMYILVTGNNYLMMFVGWEGVGVCSFLLIGFWFDKPHGVGEKNSNAAKKAMIANRVGDFGMLMAIFLMFWTFGTLDYYRPGEIANVPLAEEAAHNGDDDHADEQGALGSDYVLTAFALAEDTELPHYTNNDHIPTNQLGVFGQAERFLEAEAEVNFGPFTLPISAVITIITLFLLLGAAGKSAQIPLFVWLPDAMAGPTPVSALIHAATMVTAGVYMIVRSNVLYTNAELTSFIVTMIGASTAVMAGFIALGQWDIKRVLAYSTISQLGFMVAACGVGAFGAAMFHMVTHAFFKALLFLGSGSVIHGVEHGYHHVHEHGKHGEEPDPEDHQPVETHHDEKAGQEAGDFDPQDMRNMGGLRRNMPITYWTYMIGTLALAGIIPFAGFWSKDEILADSWLAGLFGETVLQQFSGFIALALLLGAAGFTAFYMWRQIEMVFHGTARTEAAEHAPESVPSMTLPLIVLAFFSIVIGFINMPGGFLGLSNIFGKGELIHFLEYTVVTVHPYAPEGGIFNPVIAIPALAIGLGGILLARSIYGRGRSLTANRRDPLAANPSTGSFWQLANARLYWDEFYFRIIINPFQRIAVFLADTLDWNFWHDYFHNSVIVRGFNAIAGLLSRPVDLGLIDGAVNGVARLVGWVSRRARRVQTGYVRTYAISIVLGVIFVIILLLLPIMQNS